MMSTDELAEIEGIQPKQLFGDDEEIAVKSKTSKSVYKVKRTLGHYYCTCPAWRNQARVRVEARTCKHLREVLGDAYEDARVRRATGADGSADAHAVSSKSKMSASKAARAAGDGLGKAKADGKDGKPKSTRRGGAAKRAQGEDELKAENDDEGENEDSGDKEPARNVEQAQKDAAGVEVDGVKPKRVLADGESVEVKSQTSNSMYKIKRTWDHYYCSCPAWRNQSRAPVNARTCKHLRELLGDAFENARLKHHDPEGFADAASGGRRGAKRKADGGGGGGGTRKRSKKANADDDDGDDGEDKEEKPAKAKAPDLLLATKWDLEKGLDPTGWWISEKLDGVRVFYDKGRMVSRLGNEFTPPPWFIEKLPTDVALDGELFGGRGTFQSTVSVVKTRGSPHWQNITFQIFDVPSLGEKPFEERVEYLHASFGADGPHMQTHVCVVQQTRAESREHVLEMLKQVEGKGGEGLMLRQPASLYEGRRSSTLQKIKTFYDAEARVTGYVPGKGKNKGVAGALKCVMASGKTFNVGTGLSDKQRQNPPKIGSIIVYRFQELTNDGVPRFPAFVGDAFDKTEPKDAEIPESRKTNGGAIGMKAAEDA